MRVLETLYYHSAHNPRYIEEIKSALTEMGILPEKYVQRKLFVKDEFKKTEFWKEGVIFINDRIQNPRTGISSLKDARIDADYKYSLRTGEIKEEIILDEEGKAKSSKKVAAGEVEYKFSDFGENVVRSALDRFEFYKFKNLKNYFPHIKSVDDFILSPDYLGNVEIEISGPKDRINQLTSNQKLEIALSAVKKISEQAKTNTSKFKGTEVFKAKLLREVFRDKKIKIDADAVETKELEDVNLKEKGWYAQTSFYGTSEEQNFIKFVDGFVEKLREKYSDIALLRNEKFFQVFDFDEGRAFEPDFVMILKKRNHKISIYQIFIEPKGDQFKDNQGGFENSKEGWKQKFLLELEKKAQPQGDLIMKAENKEFKLVGLPFYNEKLKKDFEEALEAKVLL
jgi:type III restriction enzyme